MERGNIVAWKFKAGDAIKAGDVLTDIETDKATLGFENQEDGVLAKILMPDGSKDVPVGTPVAIVVEDAALVPAFADYTPSSSGAQGPAAPAAPAPSSSPASAAAPAQPAVAANHRIGPAARMLLQGAGLTAGDIKLPSGPRSIITKGDVLAAIEAGVKPSGQPPTAPAPSAAAAAAPVPAPPAAAPGPAPSAAGAKPPAYVDIPNTQIRKVIASRLLASKVGIPSLYVTADVVIDELLALRKSLAAQGVKVSVNDCVLKAVALALKEVPSANVFWDEPSAGSKPFSSIDISVAVATDKGLITPIVKAADSKSLTEISADVKQLAAKAKANKLKPEEFQGGSFTVSNLGMFGLTSFSAIINPPQAAILAVGGSAHKTVLVNGKPTTQTVMTVTVSADHRVYDGELTAEVLAAFSRNMSAPTRLLM